MNEKYTVILTRYLHFTYNANPTFSANLEAGQWAQLYISKKGFLYVQIIHYVALYKHVSLDSTR